MSAPDEITTAVNEVGYALSHLLELIISRAAVQAASAVTPLIRRQGELERRLEANSDKIADMHRRLDERAEQIDAQEERITALEERAVGGTT